MRAEPGLVYLVTGGCGFLGRHLVRLLARRERQVAEIRVFDLRGDPELCSLSTEALQVKLIQGDIADAGSVTEAARGVDLVIHTAGLVDVWQTNTAERIWAVNCQGTINVLNACKELGIRYLLYTSSMEVVGPNMDRDHFIRGNEDTKYNIQNVGPYAQSKAKAEKLVLSANGEKVASGGTLVTCSLRPTGIYGEDNPIMEKLYHSLMAFGGRRLRLAGREVEHGRVYVGNVAWMHLLAARALHRTPDVLGGQVYFCYDDSPYLSYEDFDSLILGPVGIRMVGRTPVLPYWALYLLALLCEGLALALRQTGAIFNRYTLAMITTAFSVRTNKASRHFGYSPLVPWAQSWARTQAWVQSLAGRDARGPGAGRTPPAD
ncbi:3 beta-hydroxysteroid dehydrogenase type 7 [Pristis pectinata]|uniref:3 beta-hydroxysteroid dehydrogenase type 7 n=1 Tax=Pristis pectinata TaxID=685728 RepID=UPI00223DE7FD|nr:3 beta-hydroxysteroid dehydrogenase type 7 [Pristis pectinata]